jgi:predicted choloylglycine hydrolase
MRVYEFRGSAREVGRQQGEAFRDGMASFIEKHCKFPQLSPRRKEDTALGLLGELDGFCPLMADEIRGIAEGAGLPLVDVCGYNFLNFLNSMPGDVACSNVMFRTSDRGPLLGKNADLGKDAPQYTALLVKRYDTGLSMAGYTYRGWVGMQGVSSLGLATGGSSVTLKEKPAAPKGFPDSIVMGVLLCRCATVAEAVQFLTGAPFFGKGANVALADAGGDAAVVEISSTHKRAVGIGEARTLACTNFLLSGAAEQASAPAYIANAKARYEIIRRMTKDAGPLTLDLMLSILRHRAESGVSLCQRDEKMNMHSRPSYVAMPAERAVLMTDDYPDRSEFVEYSL